MPYKNVLFDLDGTLTDPAEGITNSLMHAQRRLGMAVSPREKLYAFIGPPLIEMFMSEWGLTREESEQALVYYREHFAVKGLFENVPYEGIGETLADLKASGLRLFVATSKPEPLSLRILEHFGPISRAWPGPPWTSGARKRARSSPTPWKPFDWTRLKRSWWGTGSTT